MTSSASDMPNGADTQMTDVGMNVRTVTPTSADKNCPPTTLRGCASFDSGTPNTSTAVAPKDGMRRVVSIDGDSA